MVVEGAMQTDRQQASPLLCCLDVGDTWSLSRQQRPSSSQGAFQRLLSLRTPPGESGWHHSVLSWLHLHSLLRTLLSSTLSPRYTPINFSTRQQFCPSLKMVVKFDIRQWWDCIWPDVGILKVGGPSGSQTEGTRERWGKFPRSHLAILITRSPIMTSTSFILNFRASLQKFLGQQRSFKCLKHRITRRASKGCYGLFARFCGQLNFESIRLCCAVLSHVQLFVSSWAVTHHTSLSMGILQARIME